MLRVAHFPKRTLRLLPGISWTHVNTYSSAAMPYNVIHKPVLGDQVLEQLSPRAGGVYCDMTFGDGGYTRAILGWLSFDAYHTMVLLNRVIEE